MSEHRPRPHDHLVEPLFEGLAGAHAEPRAEPGDEWRRRLGHAPVLIALLIGLGVAAWLLSRPS